MKLSKRILSILSIGAVLPITTMPIVACKDNTDYSTKYSARVKAVVNHLVEMNKNARCTWKDYEYSSTLKMIRSYICSEAYKAGIAVEDITIDNYGNLWFDVPATTGCEEYEPLILQAHMDMVVDGLSDADKKIKPIDTVVDWKNGIVHSKDYKTTLGADDGFGVALMLTLIQDKTIAHGPLRLLFTANEDSGMIGASWINKNKPDLLKKMGKNLDGKDIKFLLNIDAEELGYAYQSCTGSITYDYSCEYDVETTESPLAGTYFIEVKGLLGGHSGDNVPKNYASAEKLTFEILNKIGGNKIQIVKNYHPNEKGEDVSFARNQIVDHSRLLFRSSVALNDIKTAIESLMDGFKNQYPHEDWSKNLITYGDASSSGEDFSKYISTTNSANVISKLGGNVGPSEESTERANNIWYGCFDSSSNGRMSANISPVDIHLKKDDQTKFAITINSQIRTVTNNGLNKMKQFYSEFKFKDALPVGQSEYPAWIADNGNKLVQRACESYTKHGITPKKYDSPGGVEPTFWVSCNDQLQVTAIGADIKNAHKRTETLYIDTIQPVIDVTIDLIKSMEQGVNKN